MYFCLTRWSHCHLRCFSQPWIFWTLLKRVRLAAGLNATGLLLQTRLVLQMVPYRLGLPTGIDMDEQILSIVSTVRRIFPGDGKESKEAANSTCSGLLPCYFSCKLGPFKLNICVLISCNIRIAVISLLQYKLENYLTSFTELNNNNYVFNSFWNI